METYMDWSSSIVTSTTCPKLLTRIDLRDRELRRLQRPTGSVVVSVSQEERLTDTYSCAHRECADAG